MRYNRLHSSPKLRADFSRQRRQQWAQQHRDWDFRPWKHWVFSNESRYKLYCSDDRIRNCRREWEKYIDACVQQTDANLVPFIVVLGAFHYGGKSEQVIVEGPMNQQVYWWVLRQNLLPWARGTFRNNFVLIQDNAPPYKARATWYFLENQDVEVMGWSAKNPETNPIEHSWDQMAIHIHDKITFLQHNNNCVMQWWLPGMP